MGGASGTFPAQWGRCVLIKCKNRRFQSLYSTICGRREKNTREQERFQKQHLVSIFYLEFQAVQRVIYIEQSELCATWRGVGDTTVYIVTNTMKNAEYNNLL